MFSRCNPCNSKSYSTLLFPAQCVAGWTCSAEDRTQDLGHVLCQWVTSPSHIHIVAHGGFKLKAILLTQFPKCSHHAWLLHSFFKVFHGTRFFKHPLISSTLSTRESSLAAHTARTFSVQGITLSLCLLPRQSFPTLFRLPLTTILSPLRLASNSLVIVCVNSHTGLGWRYSLLQSFQTNDNLLKIYTSPHSSGKPNPQG